MAFFTRISTSVLVAGIALAAVFPDLAQAAPGSATQQRSDPVGDVIRAQKAQKLSATKPVVKPSASVPAQPTRDLVAWSEAQAAADAAEKVVSAVNFEIAFGSF